MHTGRVRRGRYDNKGFLGLAVGLLCAGALLAQPVEYHFRPSGGSHFTLTVEKTGLWSGRKHIFEFEKYTAKAVIDPHAPAASSVELTIDAESAVCKDTWLNDKDRGKVMAAMMSDMLDVKHHPQMVFRSDKVTANADGSFQVEGRLNIRGIDKPVAVMTTLEDRNSALAAVNGQATVRLKDYGLTPPKVALGAIGTKNEMTVSFRLIPAGGTQ